MSVDAVTVALWRLLEHGPEMAARAVAADPGNGAHAAAHRLMEVIGR